MNRSSQADSLLQYSSPVSAARLRLRTPIADTAAAPEGFGRQAAQTALPLPLWLLHTRPVYEGTLVRKLAAVKPQDFRAFSLLEHDLGRTPKRAAIGRQKFIHHL